MPAPIRFSNPMQHDGRKPALTPEILRQSHPRQRVDLLRTWLRAGSLGPTAASAELEAWIQLFYASEDPALLVLLLELFGDIDDERVVAVAQSALTHRGDGVRLESMRLILNRHPEQIARLAESHRRDRSLEVQLLLAERLYDTRPADALDFLFEVFEAERDGPRERHALERGLEFLVENAAGPATRERLRRIQPDFDDAEGFIAWGIAQMERPLT